GARASEAGGAFDGPFRQEPGRLGEVPAGPGEPDGERLGVHLLSPFDAPSPLPRVRDRDAGLRASEVLLDEPKGRLGPAAGAARPGGQVERRDVAGVAPDGVGGGAQRPGTCLPQLPCTERPPGTVY